MSIQGNNALTNLDGLSGLNSLDGGLGIYYNDALLNLDGLSGINSVDGGLGVLGNPALPDCEVCDLLDQLTSTPTGIDVFNNLDDTCTPVPASCP